ncbi:MULTISPECIES: spirocyclase AveC family protein [unclassified Mycobacterium]|uniref:spirocyclase AveC family protein n=1 Tax=unclassified Mycobacterium TaxID=2642494 RepID=UPI0029C77625|nr:MULTISPECIES: spirocyclase AveC family protein [unclassified Mycobacterium]
MTTEQFLSPQGHPDGARGLTDFPPESPPIVWLARLGAAFVVIQAYIYLRWIFSNQFVSTPTGADPIPGSELVWIRVWEAVCIVGGIVFLGWIIRKTRRDGALPALGVVVFAWLLTAWQDPGVNYIRPVFSYTSGFFNRGTWAQFIPGWVNHAGANPQPIWFWLGTYMLFFPLGVLGVDKLLTAVRRAVPRINRAGLIAFMFVTFSFLEFVVEQIFQRMGLWAYPRVNHDWSLFTGTITQFPIYEGLAFGGTVSVIAMIIYCLRRKDGYMITDTGIQTLRNKRTVGTVRVLALAAVLNVVMLVFNMGFNVVNQHADTTPPSIPSYFSNGMCGLADNVPCTPPTSR